MNNLYLQNLMSLNMDILEVDDILLGSWWHAERISSPYTRIYMPTKGTGYLSFGSTQITMTPGNIYIIPAGVSFSYRCEEGFSKIYFHISVRRAGGYDIFENTNDYFIFPENGSLERISGCFPVDTVTKVMEIKEFLFSTLLVCLKRSADFNIESFSDRICEAMMYISQNLSSQLTAARIADAVFLSPAKLRKLFKDEVGISLGKYIDDSVLLAAEKKVRLGKLPIHDISESLGFCDQFYFSRCFSKKFGMPPRQYRKVHQTTGFTL